jgi:hypothetical protein
VQIIEIKLALEEVQRAVAERWEGKTGQIIPWALIRFEIERGKSGDTVFVAKFDAEVNVVADDPKLVVKTPKQRKRKR